MLSQQQIFTLEVKRTSQQRCPAFRIIIINLYPIGYKKNDHAGQDDFILNILMDAIGFAWKKAPPQC
jgi:hypothetical protein